MWRVILLALIVYLLFRSIASYGARESTQGKERKPDPVKPDTGKQARGISKDVGEYIDYEEVKEE